MCIISLFRFEQTTAEAKKIAEVKEELQKLDAELAADVTILRKEIEAAALNYAHYKYWSIRLVILIATQSKINLTQLLLSLQKKLRSNRISISEGQIGIASVIGKERFLVFIKI